VPIPYKGTESEVEAYAQEVYERIREAGIRVHLDEEEKMQPGEKFYRWEMFGVPVRVEVGPRDLKERRVTISERDNLERSTMPLKELIPTIKELFTKIMRNLEERSRSVMERAIVEVDDVASLKRAIKNRKIARVCWCESVECAEKMKDESGGEIRGHRFDIDEKPDRPCIICGRKAERIVYVARAY